MNANVLEDTDIYRNRRKKYKELEEEVLRELKMPSWNVISYCDAPVIVRSRQSVEKYSSIMFFKENREYLALAKTKLEYKIEIAAVLKKFLKENKYKEHAQYERLEKQIKEVINNAKAYRINVDYISSAGNHLDNRTIDLNMEDLDRFEKFPFLLMSKSECNKYIKEQQKKALAQKQHTFYESINNIIDYANASREILFIKRSEQYTEDNYKRSSK